MRAHPDSDEALVKRLLPSANPDPQDRAYAWAEWHAATGGQAVLKFIRAQNRTAEPDEDILQETLLTAYLAMERGHYEHRAGIPFTAYVKGIARNKIREAHRRRGRWEMLDDSAARPADSSPRQIEAAFESQERQQALHQAIVRLPARRRQVLERYLGGESLSEIASTLQITEELVRQDKHRGLRRLRQLSRLN
jgi:RNA polymerase sigma-70 factor (ECF subfamily)